MNEHDRNLLIEAAEHMALVAAESGEDDRAADYHRIITDLSQH